MCKQQEGQHDPETVKKAAAEFLRELTEGWKKENPEQAQEKALPDQPNKPQGNDRPDQR